jgi:DNA-binding transcriptional ArsR family regulator
MRPDPDIAAVAALIADPSRAAMLDALLADPPLTAGELARRARITPQTASSHLGRLVSGGLVTAEHRGRFREFRLAGPDVARAIEALSLLAPRPETGDESLARAIRAARTCYDHLAGALGVAVTEALRGRGWIEGWEEGFPLTAAGRAGLLGLGVDLDALSAGRRPLTRSCLDWSERRPHLAGAVGAALAARCLDEGWIVRVRHSRAVRLTDRGRRVLHGALGLTL